MRLKLSKCAFFEDVHCVKEKVESHKERPGAEESQQIAVFSWHDTVLLMFLLDLANTRYLLKMFSVVRSVKSGYQRSKVNPTVAVM